MSGSRGVARVIRAGEAYQGKQGLTYATGVTGETAGSRAICMVVATLPPGARAKSHLHRGIETAIYVVEGEAETWCGAELSERLITRAGDYLYIPADTPHVVMNRAASPCRAVVTHAAADDQAGIVLLPELDARLDSLLT